MLKEGDLIAGDIVQIDPAHDPIFGGAFMVVTEPKPWGAQGYIPMGVYMQDRDARLSETEVSPAAVQAFYRCPFAAMAHVGRAEWVVERTEPE